MNRLVLSVAMDLHDIFIQFVGISLSWISVPLLWTFSEVRASPEKLQ